MKSRNICKINYASADNELIAKRFIYETELLPEARKKFVLTTERIILVITGKGELISDTERVVLKSGELAFLTAGQRISIQPIDDFTYMYIDFYGSRAAYLYGKFGLTGNISVYEDMSSLIPIWREAIITADGENFDLLAESMILYSFSRLSRKKVTTDSAIKGALDYLAENYTSPLLSLSTMADALGYNPKYLSHLISKELSVCFSDYLKNLRMKNAVMLIEQGITSIKNLSVLSGYANPLYFSRIFKDTFGMSPSDFIEQKNNNANN